LAKKAEKTEKVNAFQQLKTDLRERNVRRLYFFHGEENFLLQYYLEQLRKRLLDELTEAFNFHKFTSETFDLQSFADSVENLPMMAENTLVWVDDIDIFKLSESDREKLVEIFRDIPEYCTVVFTFVTAAWKPDKRMKKLWDAIEDHGSVVEFARQEPRDLIPWIGRHFAAHKKQISTDLCVYLIDITGGTMTALSSEISKIAAYSGADVIRKSDIDAVTEPALDAVVFQMTDLMGQREYGAALQKLKVLLKMQQEPIAILGAIGGHFRKLATARTVIDSGKGYAEVMRLLHIGDYPARKTADAASRFSHRFYARTSALILEADHQMKTSYDDPARILELLVLRLSQEAANG